MPYSDADLRHNGWVKCTDIFHAVREHCANRIHRSPHVPDAAEGNLETSKAVSGPHQNHLPGHFGTRFKQDDVHRLSRCRREGRGTNVYHLVPTSSEKGKRPCKGNASCAQASRVQLPEKVHDFLAKGAKCAAHPQPKPFDLLAMVHSVANCATEGGKDACVTEGVDCITVCKIFAKGLGSTFKETVDCLHCSELVLLQSLKTIEFAVLEESQYQEKAEAAITKNFQREEGVKKKHPKKMRTSAQKLCNELRLDHLAEAIKSSTQVSLRPFFTLKTNNECKPFRTILGDKANGKGMFPVSFRGI
ncbi:hypothetical protein HPB48_009401 [Haemaphysalis longicornis]|uniref:Uncharacterized protein n=1 Tax=Haemaphysalis longicornis TaxID=44386 RepID=A0A9J6GW08_HAELO|nr:hypothetical protein HPB48_009401 [Haemaphysalis longicornis]